MSPRKIQGYYVPVTPAGSTMLYGMDGKMLAAKTEAGAWANLMREGAHMPYKDKTAFVKRGYTVEYWENWQP